MTRERKRYGKFLCMMLAILVTIVSILGVASQVHAEDASTITIYYDNSDSKWSSVNVHYWGSTSTTWPGIAMTPTSEKADIKLTCKNMTQIKIQLPLHRIFMTRLLSLSNCEENFFI